MFDDLAPLGGATKAGPVPAVAPAPAAVQQPATQAPGPTSPALPALPQALATMANGLGLDDLDTYLGASLKVLDTIAASVANHQDDRVRVAAAKALAEIVLKVRADKNRAGDVGAVDAEVLQAVQARALAMAATGGKGVVLPLAPKPWVTPPGQVVATRVPLPPVPADG